jgi:predicted DNA-binding protein
MNMSKKRSKTPDAIVVPLRVPPDMQKQIRGLSEKARLSDADIMRLAIERGIGAVERMFEPQSEQAA